MVLIYFLKILFFFGSFTLIFMVKYEEIVKIHHIDITYVNEEYIRNLNLSLEAVSTDRNADKALSFSLEMVKVPENLKVYAIMNQFLNNAYKPGYVEFKGNVCDVMKNPFVVNLLIVQFKKIGTIPTCPMKPGNYGITNYIIDQKIAGAAAYKDMTKAMFHIEFTSRKIEIAKLEVFLEKDKKRV